MKKQLNNVYLEGRLYDHNLKSNVSGPQSKNPGTTYIRGDISIAIDDAMTNVVKVHYIYVTDRFGGKPDGPKDDRFMMLNRILNGQLGTVISDGEENAAKLVLTSGAIGVNDFYVKENGEDKLISQVRSEGCFIKVVQELNKDEKARNITTTNIVIFETEKQDADEDRNMPERVRVKGYVFSYNGQLIPVSYYVYNPKAMEYFAELDVDRENPLYTKLWVRQESVVTIIKQTEETQFGDDFVTERENTFKSLTIVNAAKEPYDWDDESTMLASELEAAKKARSLHLADTKTRAEEFAEKRKTESAKPKGDLLGGEVSKTSKTISDGDFNF